MRLSVSPVRLHVIKNARVIGSIIMAPFFPRINAYCMSDCGIFAAWLFLFHVLFFSSLRTSMLKGERASICVLVATKMAHTRACSCNHVHTNIHTHTLACRGLKCAFDQKISRTVIIVYLKSRYSALHLFECVKHTRGRNNPFRPPAHSHPRPVVSDGDGSPCRRRRVWPRK